MTLNPGTRLGSCEIVSLLGADRRPIGSFTWSRDGKHLAMARLTVATDIVLFQGLK